MAAAAAIPIAFPPPPRHRPVTTTDPLLLPAWLQDHCQRLTSASSCLDIAISNLNLNIRRLTPIMMQALVEALDKNDQIRVINLTSTLLVPAPNVTLLPLSTLLRHHASLRVIHLSYNRLSDAVGLGQALATNTTLEELYLDYNHLTPASAVAIAQGLHANRHQSALRTLCLNSNRIGDVGGQALGQALQTNVTLQTLQLSNNRGVGSLTLQALGRALDDCANITVTQLAVEENPLMDPRGAAWLQYLVQANRAGRRLLFKNSSASKRHHPRSALSGKHENNRSSLPLPHPTPPLGLWPHVLEGLEPDPQYYFVQELPGLGCTPAGDISIVASDHENECQ